MPRTRSGLPPNVTEFQDRHGKWRLRFRKKGYPTHYFEHRPGSPGFRAEYEACLAGAGGEKENAKVLPRSIAALVLKYYATPSFKDLAESTRYTYRKILERFVKDYGHLKVKGLARHHVSDILSGMSDTPSAANNLLDRLRVLMQLALDLGWRPDDPTHKLKGYREKGDGFHTWTEDEITKFQQKYPAGTRPRRALALLLHTSQRRGDLIVMGPQNRTAENRINYRQEKTGAWLSVPMHPDLIAELDLAPKDDPAYLMTEQGHPFTRAGFGNWFRDQCDAAGLKHCSAHGLRKAAARRLAEAGCSHAEIKAVTGHKTDREVTRYIQAANQAKLADRALANLQKGEPVG